MIEWMNTIAPYLMATTAVMAGLSFIYKIFWQIRLHLTRLESVVGRHQTMMNEIQFLKDEIERLERMVEEGKKPDEKPEPSTRANRSLNV